MWARINGLSDPPRVKNATPAAVVRDDGGQNAREGRHDGPGVRGGGAARPGGAPRARRRRRFRRNEVIFHQGDPGDSLHIIASGAVKIVLPSAEGDEAIIATLRAGDFFGGLALRDGAP